jgi:hypothetical protein
MGRHWSLYGPLSTFNQRIRAKDSFSGEFTKDSFEEPVDRCRDACNV